MKTCHSLDCRKEYILPLCRLIEICSNRVICASQTEGLEEGDDDIPWG